MTPVLYTFSISHFSEKIRWTLDACSFPYREVRLTPVLHVATMLRLRQRRTTVPVLETDAGITQDSTRILHWLEANHAPFDLIPKSPEQREALLGIEARFDDVGNHVLRYLYGHALTDRNAVIRMWTLDAGPLARAALWVAFPAIRAAFQKQRRIGPRYSEESAAAIELALDWLAERVAKTRYLVGEQLTVADISAASILAPIALPDPHPVYGSEAYRRAVRAPTERWREHPALAWVRDVYARHR